MSPKWNDDQSLRSTFTRDEDRCSKIAVRPEVGVGQVWAIEHHMGRKRRDHALVIGRQILRR